MIKIGKDYINYSLPFSCPGLELIFLYQPQSLFKFFEYLYNNGSYTFIIQSHGRRMIYFLFPSARNLACF